MSEVVFGLNPYGLTYYLGLQGMGGPRANPRGAGLEGFQALGRELGAKVMEIFDPWLRAMTDAELAALRARLEAYGVTPIISWGLMMGPFKSALRSARALGATTIRCGLTTVLCGDCSALGDKWPELVASVGAALADYGPRSADEGYRLVRCALGDGAVPVRAMLDLFARHRTGLTAVLEPGALEARHVRFLTPDWWGGYPPKCAEALARCLAAARVNHLPEDADFRTP